MTIGAKKAFQNHKNHAASRGIPFLFSFEEWWAWWQTDGRWNSRGRGRDRLVMARTSDNGPYHPSNVYCATGAHNSGWRGWPDNTVERHPSISQLRGPRLNITVTPPQLTWLTREAKRLGVSVGELVRRILDEKRETK